MANQTVNGVTILIRNDTAANWTAANPVLSKGEFGVEIDTKKFKIGDGVTTWSQLVYSGATVQVSSTNGHLIIDGVDVAVYTLPALTLADISGAGTAAGKDAGISAGNVPVLDANGKLNTSVLPALAITDTLPASSEADMLALSAQKGDMCIRTDTNAVYVLSADDPGVLANWLQINVPAGSVISVNGQTGTVVLDSDDIAEGSNHLYYTDSRFNTAFAGKSSGGLTDGSTILHSTDTLVLDCGNA